jgi:hypothetical protein
VYRREQRQSRVSPHGRHCEAIRVTRHA